RVIRDLTAVLALVRPGAASGAAKSAYVRRAHAEERPRPPHPALAILLEETYGLILYEEQLMAVISELTGLPLDEADEIRASLIRDSGQAAALKERFVGLATQRGLISDEAASVWETIERFAAYTFNKAHAASYAAIAWQSAYLKTHHPIEFACAVL